jgi:ABC-type transporter Mla subunit MlaD
MSQKTSYFRLGIFIVVAAAIFVAIVLALGAGNVFKRTVTIETYFDESVQGLDIGSAVKYRGVQIGRVTRVGFTRTQYEQDTPMKSRRQYVLVEAELEPALIGAREGDTETLMDMIGAGLRARLAPVGITGTAYLEIDFVDPKANPPLAINWAPQRLYIPSAPSTYNRIVSGAQKFLATLDNADIEGTIHSIAVLARTANDKLGELPVGALAHDASASLKELRALIARLDRTVAAPEVAQAVKDLGVASARLREVLANPAWATAPGHAAEAFARVREVAENPHLQDSLVRLDRILTRLDTLTAGADADFSAALYNLRRVSENLRDLTETVKRYPGSVLGEPPRPVAAP